MRWIRAVLVLLAAVLVQATMVPALEVRGSRPDVVLLVVVFLAVRNPGSWRGAFWTGWAGGLLVDVYSIGGPVRFGMTALVFGLVAVAVWWLGTELFLESVIAQVLVLAPVCLVTHGVLSFCGAAATGGPVGVGIRQAVGTAVYSALAAPVVFALMRPVGRVMRLRSERGYGRA